MKVCIQCGTKEIGGTCIEIASSGKRLVLDLGLPIDHDVGVPLPQVKGFVKEDRDLLGIFISHPHQNHYGLAIRVLSDSENLYRAVFITFELEEFIPNKLNGIL